MPLFFIYLLKLSVSLAAVFLFYHFVLRKLTFYNWNRWYLLGYSMLSFFIALINIAPVLERNEWSGSSIVEWVPVIRHASADLQNNDAAVSLSVWQWIGLLMLAGMLIMFLRLLLQLISFRRLMKKAQPLAVGLLPGSGMKLYQVEENIIPFSFGNSIFINYHLHTKDELREIVWHEFIHVKQKHSLDIICGEILCLLNWYNPFAWLIRRSIRQNLEFIADNKVLENGINRKEYQYLLLKVIGNNHFSIAPKFNFSSLKKRIAMMNKMKSAGVHVVKFLFILPLIAVLLVAFRNKIRDNNPPFAGTGNVATDTIPVKSGVLVKMPKEISSISVMKSNDDPNVADPVKQKLSGMVFVKRADGQKESYDLDSKESLEKFEKKYAVKLEDLIPPPPPPPVPPAKQVHGVEALTPAPPTPPVPPTASSEDAITPVAESNGQGSNLFRISNEYEITDKKAEIKLKDGTVEKYDLTNKEQRAAFEKKYGKLVHINTNIQTAPVINLNTNLNSNVSTNLNTTLKTNVNTNVNTIAPVIATTGTLITASPVAVGSSNLVTTIAPAATGSNHSGVLAVASTTPRPATMAGVIDDYGHVITGKEEIIITITSNATRQDLDKFITQMKAKGVELDFDDIEYNEKGKLVHINGTMKAGESKSNFVVTDFTTVVLAMTKKDGKVWFKVNVKEKEVI